MVCGNCSCAHYVCMEKVYYYLVWQVDNVLIEAGSLVQAGDRSKLF